MRWLLDLVGVGPLDAELRKALVTGLLGFFGVLLTGVVAVGTWVGNKRFERRQERERRGQVRRDLETALLAEIDAVWRQWIVTAPGAVSIAAVRAQFAADPGYVPFVTAETGVMVFPAVIQQIPVLDEAEIAPIIRFYRQVKLIDAFASEMKSKTFAGLEPPRREAMMVHYLTMIETAVQMAEEAIMFMERLLKVPERDGLSARKASTFSNMGAARTAPASEAAG